jgi:hypothetical protein
MNRGGAEDAEQGKEIVVYLKLIAFSGSASSAPLR